MSEYPDGVKTTTNFVPQAFEFFSTIKLSFILVKPYVRETATLIDQILA